MIKRAIWILLTISIVGVFLSPPLHLQTSSGPRAISLLPFSIFPEVLALNSGQSYPPHGYYAEQANCGGAGGFATCPSGLNTGCAGSNGGGVFVQSGGAALNAGQQGQVCTTMPNPADQALACSLNYSVWANAGGVANALTYFVSGAIGNAEKDTGCPQFPWHDSHEFGPGPPPVPIGSGDGADIMVTSSTGYSFLNDEKAEEITYFGLNGCGGPGSGLATLTISSCSFLTPTVTCTTTANITTLTNGDLVQVFGTSLTGNNSQPGPGTNGAFTVSSSTTNTFSYSDANGGSSTGGTVSFPYVAGAPPFNTPNGANGTSQPQVIGALEVPNSVAYSISYSIYQKMFCVPLVACLYSNGCGIGNTFQ